MQIQTLDELLNGVETWTDIELKIFHDHAINMMFQVQDSNDSEALDYWSTLAGMIGCEIKNRG